MIKIGILLTIPIILSLSESMSNLILVILDCGLKSMIDGRSDGAF